MRRFVYLMLFIFAPGNALLKTRDCGGKISVLRERSGSIRYHSHPDSSIFNETTDNSTKKLLNITCTWIIDSHVNQKVWIDVLSLSNGSLGLKFGNEDKQTYERDERALFSGTGRTIIQWDRRYTVKTSGALHLRWSISDSSHDPALISYTHSDADPVSPSPSSSNRVTYTPDIPERGNVTPKTHTLRGESVQQGEGVSDLADIGRPHFPQENTNNGQETAGTWISDPTLAGTNSYFDTDTVLSHEPFTARSSSAIYKPLLSLHTTPKQSRVITAKTSTLSLLDTNYVTHTETHTGRSQHIDTHTFTKILTNTLRAKRSDPISMFPTASFISVSPRNRDTNSKQEDFSSDSPNETEVTTLTNPNQDVLTISESVRKNQFHVDTVAITHKNRPLRSETDKTDSFLMSTHPNVSNTTQYMPIYDDSTTVSNTPVVPEFPDLNQSNPLVFSDSNTIKHSEYSEPLDSTNGINEPSINVTVLSTIENEPTTLSGTEHIFSTNQFMHMSHISDTMQPLTSSEASTIHFSSTESQHKTSTQQTRSVSTSISTETTDLTAFTSTTPPVLTPGEGPSTPKEGTEPFPHESDCHNLTCTSYEPSTIRQNEERQESLITTPPLIPSSGSASPHSNLTSDLTVEGMTTVRFENRTYLKEPDISPSQVQNTNTHTNSPPAMHSNTPEPPIATPIPQYSTPSLESTQSSVDFSGNITHTSSGQTVAVSNSSPTHPWLTQSNSSPTQLTTLGLSNDVQTGSMGNVDSIITRTTVLSASSVDMSSTYISHSSPVSVTNHDLQTSTSVSTATSHWDTSQTSAIYPPSLTTKHSKMTLHATSTESPSVQLHTHSPLPGPSTIRPPEHMTTNTHLIQTNSHSMSTQLTQASWIQSTAFSLDRKWPHGKHFFIVEDQPAIIKEETFQILLQITLEENVAPNMRLHEMEPFLQSVSGYQSQHVTWHSGPVLQTVVKFQTMKALSWLGRAESLLQEAGLNPLPKTGIFVGGVKVKNIKVGGLQEDICEWLFECPSGFQCVSSKGNASCISVCHFDYCKHQGICVHRPKKQPLCQCPVGEDYWFMGQRCDLRMTRPRLVGVCFGVLIAVAAVMALLSYLAVRRFKSMLMQAKVEQTRSSYRRFNHFDELSARFWGKSWPGSEDSLDNPAFTRSDELLHLRALDRTCCYHDDSLSIVSTYHGSGTHLNTIYPHSSQYGWDLSNCSLADGVGDSGKASDLSVCSWPIEPIQWTPFPLLQQLNRNTTTVKASRPRSYCEGMELVDLEKSWTA